MDDDNEWVLGLHSYGFVDYDSCVDTLGSRPAFLIPSGYAVEVDKLDNPLEDYTTSDLLAEIGRRLNG